MMVSKAVKNKHLAKADRLTRLRLNCYLRSTLKNDAVMHEDLQAYIHDNQDRFLNELLELLRIPSISADSEYTDQVKEAAEYVRNKLAEAGADTAEVCPTDGNPVVYGEKQVSDDLPTVLVYGHYDVQPPDPLDEWDSAPFEPVIRDGKVYARGACDDKGQMYMHVKAFEFMNQTGNLPCNMKFIIEGEEEVGSPNVTAFANANRDKLKADVLLLSDTAMISNEQPSIPVGLRGLCYLEVGVYGPNRDLHSGVYGGAIANPANVLGELIATLKDENGRINIPGFYDQVQPPSEEEKAKMKDIPVYDEDFKKAVDVNALNGEKGYSAYESTSLRPTLDVNGIWGGYIKEGAKTVLPAEAHAKISMRLVPDQDEDEIAELVTQHLHKIAPASVKVQVDKLHGAKPVVVSTDRDEYQAASQAYQETFGTAPLPVRTGGSIPIVAFFSQQMEMVPIMMGFGLDSDAIHSPNEKFNTDNFFKGIETIPLFFKHLATLKQQASVS